jgi:hypothetical protein
MPFQPPTSWSWRCLFPISEQNGAGCPVDRCAAICDTSHGCGSGSGSVWMVRVPAPRSLPRQGQQEAQCLGHHRDSGPGQRVWPQGLQCLTGWLRSFAS